MPAARGDRVLPRPHRAHGQRATYDPRVAFRVPGGEDGDDLDAPLPLHRISCRGAGGHVERHATAALQPEPRAADPSAKLRPAVTGAKAYRSPGDGPSRRSHGWGVLWTPGWCRSLGASAATVICGAGGATLGAIFGESAAEGVADEFNEVTDLPKIYDDWCSGGRCNPFD